MRILRPNLPSAPAISRSASCGWRGSSASIRNPRRAKRSDWHTAVYTPAAPFFSLKGLAGLEQHAQRLLQQSRNFLEEAGGDGTVQRTVIHRHRDLHDVADDDLPVAHHRRW